MSVLLCAHGGVNQQVTTWFQRSLINYQDYYLRLYIAYNAWYQQVAHTVNDRQALYYLRSQTSYWPTRMQLATLAALHTHMVLLAELTQRDPPFRVSPHWSGSIEHVADWDSLIEYWYQVRCCIVHGAPIRQEYVELAYQTLRLFMQDIVK